MYLDSATSQDGSAHFASSLAAVDEENFLVSKHRAATQWWWAIHTNTSDRELRVAICKRPRIGSGAFLIFCVEMGVNQAAPARTFLAVVSSSARSQWSRA
jgi:hypothetical protein